MKGLDSLDAQHFLRAAVSKRQHDIENGGGTYKRKETRSERPEDGGSTSESRIQGGDKETLLGTATITTITIDGDSRSSLSPPSSNGDEDGGDNTRLWP